MKRNILYVILFGVIFSLTGCLNVDIIDRVEKEDGFYKTEDHALSAIYGVYATLTEFAYHKTNWPLILSTYEDAMFATGKAVPVLVLGIPLIVLAAGLWIGTPVYAEFRYAYPFFLAAPFLIAVTVWEKK